MKQISKINVLVHPDFDAWTSGDTTLTLHPLQHGLRNAWSQRVDEIAARDDAMLIYLSALPSRTLSRPQLNGIELDEVNRIASWSNILKERMLLISYSEAMHDVRLHEQLSERGLAINTTNATLLVFGEYEELCVSSWAERIGSILGIPKSHTEVEARLSLSHYDYDAGQHRIMPRKER